MLNSHRNFNGNDSESLLYSSSFILAGVYYVLYGLFLGCLAWVGLKVLGSLIGFDAPEITQVLAVVFMAAWLYILYWFVAPFATLASRDFISGAFSTLVCIVGFALTLRIAFSAAEVLFDGVRTDLMNPIIIGYIGYAIVFFVISFFVARRRNRRRSSLGKIHNFK